MAALLDKRPLGFLAQRPEDQWRKCVFFSSFPPSPSCAHFSESLRVLESIEIHLFFIVSLLFIG